MHETLGSGPHFGSGKATTPGIGFVVAGLLFSDAKPLDGRIGLPIHRMIRVVSGSALQSGIGTQPGLKMPTNSPLNPVETHET